MQGCREMELNICVCGFEPALIDLSTKRMANSKVCGGPLAREPFFFGRATKELLPALLLLLLMQ